MNSYVSLHIYSPGFCFDIGSFDVLVLKAQENFVQIKLLLFVLQETFSLAFSCFVAVFSAVLSKVKDKDASLSMTI